MPKFYTSVILLINQSKEICEKQFSVFGSKGGQNSPLMHVPLYDNQYFLFDFSMSTGEKKQMRKDGNLPNEEKM